MKTDIAFCSGNLKRKKNPSTFVLKIEISTAKIIFPETLYARNEYNKVYQYIYTYIKLLFLFVKYYFCPRRDIIIRNKKEKGLYNLNIKQNEYSMKKNHHREI